MVNKQQPHPPFSSPKSQPPQQMRGMPQQHQQHQQQQQYKTQGGGMGGYGQQQQQQPQQQFNVPGPINIQQGSGPPMQWQPPPHFSNQGGYPPVNQQFRR